MREKEKISKNRLDYILVDFGFQIHKYLGSLRLETIFDELIHETL